MSELLDKNGLTEQEFLAAYDPGKYERPSVTVDLAVFTRDLGSVLLIRRGGHPFLGKLALPGGFVEPNETVEQAAARELLEETGIQSGLLHQLSVFSDPKRDPRTRIITVPFLALLAPDASPHAGDDASDAAFWRVEVQEEPDRLHFTLRDREQACSFTVRCTVPIASDGFVGDPSYTLEGDSPLAGDHACILACAWNEARQRISLY